MNVNHEYGLIPSPTAVRDFMYDICCGDSSSTIVELPEKFELPINDWVKVYNQGDKYACVSYALAQAREAYHSKITGESVSYSPGAIYGADACRNGYDGKGMYLRTAMNGVTKIGFVEASVFDIIEEMPEMKAIVDARPDLIDIGAPKKLKGFVSLNYSIREKKIRSIKEALYTYRVPLVVSSTDYFGGAHCFLLYGWDDSIELPRYRKDEVAFLLRNSWGEEYGDGGNSHIPFSELNEVYLPIFEDFRFPFTDVPRDKWYYQDIVKGVFSGLVNGVSKTTFAPEDNIIRGDVAITISRLLDKLQLSVNAFLKTLTQKGITAHPLTLLTPNDEINFADVLSSDYYYNEVRNVAANGLIKGNEYGLFEPTRPITRAEFATIVVRTYNYIVALVNASVPSVNIVVGDYIKKSIPDVLDDAWYADYVQQAISIGFMSGDDTGLFRPDDMIIRAEATAVLNRLFKEVDVLLEKIR